MADWSANPAPLVRKRTQASAHLQATMNTRKCGLDVCRAALFDECAEALERLDLGRHHVQEWRRKDIHALHVAEQWPGFV